MNKENKYNDLIKNFDNMSLFDLYKIKSFITNELESPQRINKVREKFKIGDKVEYFDAASNNLISGIVEKKDHKYVSIKNCHDQKYWKIPYYMLRLDEGLISDEPNNKVTRNTLQVGDIVGFNRDGIEVVGKVIRLNQKTASIIANDNRNWRVSYALLYPVLEGKLASQKVIELKD